MTKLSNRERGMLVIIVLLTIIVSWFVYRTISEMRQSERTIKIDALAYNHEIEMQRADAYERIGNLRYAQILRARSVPLRQIQQLEMMIEKMDRDER